MGRTKVPTPGGYLKELLQPPQSGSVDGTDAYGLAGYSPVLEQFAGGQGVIGIHGTIEPESVGTDASHGCIRTRNEDVTRLVEEFGLPLGTPVEILARAPPRTATAVQRQPGRRGPRRTPRRSARPAA